MKKSIPCALAFGVSLFFAAPLMAESTTSIPDEFVSVVETMAERCEAPDLTAKEAVAILEEATFSVKKLTKLAAKDSQKVIKDMEEFRDSSRYAELRATIGAIYSPHFAELMKDPQVRRAAAALEEAFDALDDACSPYSYTPSPSEVDTADMVLWAVQMLDDVCFRENVTAEAALAAFQRATEEIDEATSIATQFPEKARKDMAPYPGSLKGLAVQKYIGRINAPAILDLAAGNPALEKAMQDFQRAYKYYTDKFGAFYR